MSDEPIAKRGGFRPQAEGKAFEATFETLAKLQGFICLKVPEAGRWMGGGVFKPIRGMCDWIIVRNDSRTAFVDTKSTQSERFTYSMIDQEQLKELRKVDHFCPAGYIVCFRGGYRIVFFPLRTLEAVRPGESLEMQDGLDLGGLMQFRIDKLFS